LRHGFFGLRDARRRCAFVDGLRPDGAAAGVGGACGKQRVCAAEVCGMERGGAGWGVERRGVVAMQGE